VVDEGSGIDVWISMVWKEVLIELTVASNRRSRRSAVTLIIWGVLAITLGCTGEVDKPNFINPSVIINIELDWKNRTLGVRPLSEECTTWWVQTVLDPDTLPFEQRSNKPDTTCYQRFYRKQADVAWQVQVENFVSSPNCSLDWTGFFGDGDVYYKSHSYMTWQQFSRHSPVRDLQEDQPKIYLLAADYYQEDDKFQPGSGKDGTLFAAVFALSDRLPGKCIFDAQTPGAVVFLETIRAWVKDVNLEYDGNTWSGITVDATSIIGRAVAHELTHCLGADHKWVDFGEECHTSNKGQEMCRCVMCAENDVNNMVANKERAQWYASTLNTGRCLCDYHRADIGCTVQWLMTY
jgi:hypothetical protein